MSTSSPRWLVAVYGMFALDIVYFNPYVRSRQQSVHLTFGRVALRSHHQLHENHKGVCSKLRGKAFGMLNEATPSIIAILQM